MSKSDELALGIGKALDYMFVSTNVPNINGEDSNVVDALDSIARALDRIAEAMEGRDDR